MRLVGVGRLGVDAEIRYTPEGTAVATLAMAFNYGQKDQNGKQPTQWVRGSLWGKRAEKLAQYLTKGTALDVTINDVHVREWESNGKSGASLEGRIETLEFVPGQKRADSTQGEERHQPVAAHAETWDDDIPF